MRWQFSHLVICFGARIGIRFNDPSFSRRLARVLPPHAEVVAWGPADRLYSIQSSDIREHVLLRNRTEIGRSQSVDRVADLLASELHETVARFSTDLFVHAGVAGWKGKAIVIPGLSMSGKTTLVAELVKQGATYYSDEYAVIGEDGWVHNYPKRLSVRRRRGKARLVSAADLGGTIGKDRLPLGWIVVAEHRDGANWEPRQLSEAESMMALIANTVMARARPEMTMQRLSRAVRGTFGFQGHRGEAAETVRELMKTADDLLRRSKSGTSTHKSGLVAM